MTDKPRAVIGEQLGPVGNYALREHDPGAPGPGGVRIGVRAAGISYVDVLVSRGEYQIKPPLPFIPGSEFAGVVEAVGDSVGDLAPGNRVMSSGFGVAFAEAAIVPAKLVRAIPDAMGFAEAACFRVSYATAYHALVQQGQLKPGEKVLVLGAGGAVGQAAIQVTKALGGIVIGSASSAEKRALALSAGADHVVDSRSPDWRDAVKAACGGERTDIVVDPVGGEATEAAFRTLGWAGRHLVIGFVAGIARLPTNLALLKGAHLIGVDIRQFGEKHPDIAERNLGALFDLYRQGRLVPHIAKRYPIADFAEAMDEAFAGQTAGRIVLEMNGGD